MSMGDEPACVVGSVVNEVDYSVSWYISEGVLCYVREECALFCAPWGMTANLHLPFGVENVVQSRDSGSMYTTKNASLMSVSDQYLDPRVRCMTCSRSGIGK